MYDTPLARGSTLYAVRMVHTANCPLTCTDILRWWPSRTHHAQQSRSFLHAPSFTPRRKIVYVLTVLTDWLDCLWCVVGVRASASFVSWAKSITTHNQSITHHMRLTIYSLEELRLHPKNIFRRQAVSCVVSNSDGSLLPQRKTISSITHHPSPIPNHNEIHLHFFVIPALGKFSSWF